MAKLMKDDEGGNAWLIINTIIVIRMYELLELFEQQPGTKKINM
jgi:hypothetical protein